MKYASKKEAQAALNQLRAAAQAHHELRENSHPGVDRDVAELRYQRALREYEEAIFDYDAYDTGDD